jgi:pimeloyl-ACP methyl ester carboxylesterase
MTLLIKTVSGALFLYMAYCGFLFLIQRHLLFPRYLIEAPSHIENISNIERIWVNTSFGRVEALFLPPMPDTAKPAPAIIFAHGNGELIDFWPHEFKPFNRLGIGVLLVEYPGYGRSDGTPSQRSIKETFIAAYDALSSREDVDSSRMILFGRSVGGGAVCMLAKDRPSAALILMSTFISVRSFASKYLAPGFLVRDPFDNLAAVKAYPAPVLVIHGKFDDIIPYGHGTVLYHAAQHGKMIPYDSGHNDCPPNWDIFYQDVASFLHDSGIL